MKRPRLRFTLRTLAIVITLACCYAACWGPTNHQGVEDVRAFMNTPFKSDPVVLAPLLLRSHELAWRQEPMFDVHRYYFWFFGFVVKLPWEREPPKLDVPLSTVEFRVHTGSQEQLNPPMRPRDFDDGVPIQMLRTGYNRPSSDILETESEESTDSP